MYGALDMGGRKIRRIDTCQAIDDAVPKAYCDANPTFVKRIGDTMTGALLMGSNSITSTFVASADNHVTNLAVVKDIAVKKVGDTMSGDLLMGGNRVTDLALVPLLDTEATPKKYCDDKVRKMGDTMSGTLDMGSNKITTTSIPTDDADVVNMAALNSKTGVLETRFVLKAGDTMGGTLDMGTNKITTTSVPTDDADVVNLAALNAVGSGYVLKTGDTMSGPLNMNGSAISNLAAPAAASDALRKQDLPVPTAVYQQAYATAAGAIAWKSEQKIETLLTESAFDNLPAGIYGMASQLLPASRRNDIPIGSRVALIVGSYSPDTYRVYLCFEINVSGGLSSRRMWMASLNDGVWVPWLLDLGHLSREGGTMTGALDMGDNKITTTSVPTDDADVVNLAALNAVAAGSGYVLITGDTMCGPLNMNGSAISNLAAPAAASDALRKQDLSVPTDRFQQAYASAAGTYAWGSHQMIPSALTESEFDSLPAGIYGIASQNLPASRRSGTSVPSASGRLTLIISVYAQPPGTYKKYLCFDCGRSAIEAGDDVMWSATLAAGIWYPWISDFGLLSRNGGTMTGAIDMGANKITTSCVPVDANDVVNMTTLEAHTGGFVLKAGDSMTGALNMSNNPIQALATRFEPDAAVNNRCMLETLSEPSSGIDETLIPTSMGRPDIDPLVLDGNNPPMGTTITLVNAAPGPPYPQDPETVMLLSYPVLRAPGSGQMSIYSSVRLLAPTSGTRSAVKIYFPHAVAFDGIEVWYDPDIPSATGTRMYTYYQLEDDVGENWSGVVTALTDASGTAELTVWDNTYGTSRTVRRQRSVCGPGNPVLRHIKAIQIDWGTSAWTCGNHITLYAVAPLTHASNCKGRRLTNVGWPNTLTDNPNIGSAASDAVNVLYLASELKRHLNAYHGAVTVTYTPGLVLPNARVVIVEPPSSLVVSPAFVSLPTMPDGVIMRVVNRLKEKLQIRGSFNATIDKDDKLEIVLLNSTIHAV
ncbi:MAG: hypothetical protein ACRC0J_11345 [Shewanella oncorhynchi]